jgi:hypothetical protein
MDQREIRDLLYRIATDADYREQLIADPVGVLGAIGIPVDPSDVPSDGIKLPTNEEILRNLDAWSTQIWHLDNGGRRTPKIWLGLP